MTAQMHDEKRPTVQRLGNGVTLGRVAYIKSAGLQGRYGVVTQIKAGLPLSHNVELRRLDNDTVMHEYGMNLRYLDEPTYLELKRLLEAELAQLTLDWEKQGQLQAANPDADNIENHDSYPAIV